MSSDTTASPIDRTAISRTPDAPSVASLILGSPRQAVAEAATPTEVAAPVETAPEPASDAAPEPVVSRTRRARTSRSRTTPRLEPAAPAPAPAPRTGTGDRAHAAHRHRPSPHRRVFAERRLPGALCEGRAARGLAAPRSRRARGAEHGGEPRGAHRDLGAHHPRKADHGQPRGHQQPPRAHARRQGELHAPHRLRDRRGARRVPRDERRVRARGRQARDVHAGARQLWACGRPREGRRLASAAGAEHQGRGPNGLRPVLARVRRPHQEGSHGRAAAHRLPRHNSHAHEPRHARHGALRAAT